MLDHVIQEAYLCLSGVEFACTFVPKNCFLKPVGGEVLKKSFNHIVRANDVMRFWLMWLYSRVEHVCDGDDCMGFLRIVALRRLRTYRLKNMLRSTNNSSTDL